MDNTAKLNTDAILSVRIIRTSWGWGEWEPINATSVDSTHIRAATIAKDSRNVTGVPSSFLGTQLLIFQFAMRKNVSGSLDGRFHQTVCLRRREPLVSSVALGEFQHGKGLTVHDFRLREDLP
jgi:hypothetical protein